MPEITTDQLYYDLTGHAPPHKGEYFDLAAGEWRPVRVRAPRRPSTRPRDSQKSKCYTAEKAVFIREEPMSLPDLTAWIHAVAERTYVRETFMFMPRWKVRDGRGHRRATATRMVGYNELTFPRWSRQRWIALHEMAHVMRPCPAASHPPGAWDWGAGHGWQFCYTYLLLVRNVLGRAAHDYLRGGFREHRVRYGPPRVVTAP